MSFLPVDHAVRPAAMIAATAVGARWAEGPSVNEANGRLTRVVKALRQSRVSLHLDDMEVWCAQLSAIAASVRLDAAADI